MNLKQTILEIADEIGFNQTKIASIAPMPEALTEYKKWLNSGYAASMKYLEANPQLRANPALLVPQASSVIIFSVSYYSPVPENPGPEYGRIANYAVGKDYHLVIPEKLKLFKEILKARSGKDFFARSFTDAVPLLERNLAERHGLGFSGKNTLIIGPKLSGSYNFLAELFVDLELEADISYTGTCGECFRCANNCPTDAIVSPEILDANLCLSYLTIENRGDIQENLRPKLGNWLFGCDLCQTCCPYNQRPPLTPWREFLPESGCGHYLNLFDLLKIQSNSEFKQRFRDTALLRTKRSGLLRNALVALGNNRPSGYEEAVMNFATKEIDSRLRLHAAWAIAQSTELNTQKQLEQLYNLEENLEYKTQIKTYLK